LIPLLSTFQNFAIRLMYMGSPHGGTPATWLAAAARASSCQLAAAAW
jgi:hypothetical protein